MLMYYAYSCNPCLVTTALRHVWTNWSCDTVSLFCESPEMSEIEEISFKDITMLSRGGGGMSLSDGYIPLFRQPTIPTPWQIYTCMYSLCMYWLLCSRWTIASTGISVASTAIKGASTGKKSCFDCHFRCFDERNSASEAAQHEYVLWSIASTDK